ncbi:MAG: histidine phosphatase family protein [Gallionella sp.]|jgi:broad specificity phosphatase PhoE|nr:histidine phosphatase family protein [Gallionella sp.]MCK9354480.1 histidine phosphatase family protein [Gallionella sp.]
MKIILVRHGESEGNVRHEINDDPKRVVNLTERGRAQAETAAEKLRDIEFTHAYASEFPRAQQTAAILLRHHRLELNIDARLNERISGMDGLHVDVFNDYVRDDYLHTKPPHGESFVEQMERLRGFLDEIAARHPDGVALAVSHENPIVAALALTVADPAQVMLRKLENCEAVELRWSV